MSHSSIHYNISALPCRMCPQVVELFYNITKLKTHKNPFSSTLTKKNIIFTENNSDYSF